MYRYSLGFVGFGNMATAIYNSVLSADLLSSKDIIVYDIDKDKLPNSCQSCTAIASDISDILTQAKFILLAFKPQNLDDFSVRYARLKKELDRHQVLISILAGVSISKLKSKIPGDYGIARVMPNLPLQVGQGVSGIAVEDVSPEDKKFVLSLFNAGGIAFEVEEHLIDAVTAISGSGPAYVFYFIEALRAAAEKIGLPADIADKMSIQTVFGAAKLAKESKDDVSALRAKVTSKGGTTEQALNVMQEAGYKDIILNAVKAALKRAKELGELD